MPLKKKAGRGSARPQRKGVKAGRGPDTKPRKKRTDKPSTQTRHKSSAKDIEKLALVERVIAFRKAGMHYDEIAEACDITDKKAHILVTGELKRRRSLLAESVEDVRAIELERLDKLYLVAQVRAATGNMVAINTCLNIMGRRAKLSGLDLPVQLETHGDLPTFLLPAGIDFTGTEFAAPKEEGT